MSEDSVTTDNEGDGFTEVGLFHKKHIMKLFFGHPNNNSLRSKREHFKSLETEINMRFYFLYEPGHSL